jgi:phosphoribosylamine--glycine ligase
MNSPRASHVIVTPGNGGVPEKDRWTYKETEHDRLIKLAEAKRINFVILGPEAAIVAGLSDKFTAAGFPNFAPSQAAARLESSKAWSFSACRSADIPVPEGGIAHSMEEATELIGKGFLVVKADGLCAGKGVVVADTQDEALAAARAMLIEGLHGEAGRTIVLQERLEGREASFMYFCDGINAIALPPARDHKRLGEGDIGPNTGGMGAFSPVPDVTPATEKAVLESIVRPILRFMRSIGTPFHGLLYAGVMLTKSGPKLIEFNVRFGDPETQVVLPRIESDILTYMLACTVEGGLSILPPLEIGAHACVCTVLASDGYPGLYETGKEIRIIGKTERISSYFIHAGTRREGDKLFTSGGRVLGAIGLGLDVAEAHQLSLAAAGRVMFGDEMPFFRRDISLTK